jgi:DNA-directed RNA polymerase subunit RPC12/RpoP
MYKSSKCDMTDDYHNYTCPTCGSKVFMAKVVHVYDTDDLEEGATEDNETSQETVIGLNCVGCPEEFLFSEVDAPA